MKTPDIRMSHGRWSGNLQQPQNFVRGGKERLQRDAIAHAWSNLTCRALMEFPDDEFDIAMSKLSQKQQEAVVAVLLGYRGTTPDLLQLEIGENKTALERVGQISAEDIPTSLPPDPCDDLPYVESTEPTYSYIPEVEVQAQDRARGVRAHKALEAMDFADIEERAIAHLDMETCSGVDLGGEATEDLRNWHSAESERLKLYPHQLAAVYAMGADKYRGWADAEPRIHRQGQRPVVVHYYDDPGCVDDDILKRIQSKKKLLRALTDGREKIAQGSPDGGSVTGRIDGGRHLSEADRGRLGEGVDRSVEVLEPSEEPLWEACAGHHQARHSSLPQARPRLGQEAGGSDMTLEAKIVKVGSGHSVQLVTAGDAWQSGQKPDGSGYGPHALVTAPELDRLIAALCKARDACRAANRPRATWGTYRT